MCYISYHIILCYGIVWYRVVSHDVLRYHSIPYHTGCVNVSSTSDARTHLLYDPWVPHTKNTHKTPGVCLVLVGYHILRGTWAPHLIAFRSYSGRYPGVHILIVHTPIEHTSKTRTSTYTRRGGQKKENKNMLPEKIITS